MQKFGPPVANFDKLNAVTMTVIISYDVTELNLDAIFALLPVTSKMLPENCKRKQGKIQFPTEFNVPGEILSMRYKNNVRGIVRSESARSFSHSIIIDIGTSERIISLKLSRPTLELTGPTSYEIAKEAAQYILNYIRECQDELNFIRNNYEVAKKIKDDFVHNPEYKTNAPSEERILNFYKRQTRGYSVEIIDKFLDFILEFKRNLYEGTLNMDECNCVMANILFNLGYSVNLVNFAKVMNDQPFECIYSNIKNSSSAPVLYHYSKYDRTTGKEIPAKHTIRVNRSGHVKYSGPGLKAMRPIYYIFMKRVLLHYDEIKSIEQSRKQVLIKRKDRCMSPDEWHKLLIDEEEFRQRVMDGDNSLIESEDKLIVENAIVEASSEMKQIMENSGSHTPRLKIDYAPIDLSSLLKLSSSD